MTTSINTQATPPFDIFRIDPAERIKGRISAPTDLLGGLADQGQQSILMTAFDAELMRLRLHTAILHETYTLEQCQPGKATYLADASSCILRYDLYIRDNRTGTTSNSLLNAQIFSTLAEGQAYFRERLQPLADRMQGRPELNPFIAPVALLDDLKMTVSVFPIDGALPELVAATDAHIMAQVLRQMLATAKPGESESLRLHQVEAGHYGRQHRCVLRYHISRKRSNTNQHATELVYGKIASDERGLIADQAINALHRQLATNGAYQFKIPRSFGYWPDLNLALIEAIPGKPQFKHLLKQQLNGSFASDAQAFSFTDAMDACAQVAATLHSSEIPLGEIRTLDDELTKLGKEITSLHRLSSELGRKLQQWLDRVATHSQMYDPLPLCFSHGDFTYTQLLFDGEMCGLVDFDTVCQAEPALDLGHFLAYLRLAIQKTAKTSTAEVNALAKQLSLRFQQSYLSAHPNKLTMDVRTQLQARVTLYEVVSLLRIALHSWQKLKSHRLDRVMIILEEVMLCLP